MRFFVYLLFSIVISSTAYAKCRAWSCYLLTFKVKSCTAETISNKEHIERMINIRGESNIKSPHIWLDMIESIHGVRLEVADPEAKIVPCYAGGKPGKTEIEIPQSFFYETSDPSFCDQNMGKTLTKFYAGQCCDTIPQRAWCLAKPMLIDQPSFIVK